MKILSLGFLIVSLLLSGCSIKKGYPKQTYTPSISQSQKTTPKDTKQLPPTMRPYQVDGRWYYPTVVSVGSEYDGVASWYGPDFHGKKTSSGERYNMHALTAAHKTFPMNTIVKVENKKNGKSVIVRINDRGPFVGNRIIDLSEAAAANIGMIAEGTAPVRLTVLGFGGKIETLTNPNDSVELTDFYVQIGAFRKRSGADTFAKQYAKYDKRYDSVVQEGEYKGEKIYRVWLRGFRSEEEARDFVYKHKNNLKGAFIIRGDR